MTPGGVSQPDRIGGWVKDPAKPLYVVTLTATNRMLLAGRWGWQHLLAELLSEDGSATKSYPIIIDRATDQGWVGDLAPGASVTSQFLFYPSNPLKPAAFRLTFLASGRMVEIRLR